MAGASWTAHALMLRGARFHFTTWASKFALREAAVTVRSADPDSPAAR